MRLEAPRRIVFERLKPFEYGRLAERPLDKNERAIPFRGRVEMACIAAFARREFRSRPKLVGGQAEPAVDLPHGLRVGRLEDTDHPGRGIGVDITAQPIDPVQIETPRRATRAGGVGFDVHSIREGTLYIEWMTQRHYLESVKDDQDLDPQFKSLLRHHWTEEAQHAKLDTLIVEALAVRCTAAEVGTAVDGYLEIDAFLDSGLRQQVEFDLDSFEVASGRALSSAEWEAFIARQMQAARWTFLGSGMSHPRFEATLRAAAPAAAAAKVAEVAPVFS